MRTNAVLSTAFPVRNAIKQVNRSNGLLSARHFRFLAAKYLSAYKIKALSYHAGLTDSKRQTVQTQWATDDCQVS